jgi:GT2 family glycosyltransferase
MAAARGAFILFTDDDILPSKNWLANLCAPLLRGEADAAVGKVRLAPHLNRPWMNKDFRAWLADTEALDAREPSRMVGANMAFCRTVLDRVPAFDPELGPGALGYGEDTLFSLQVRAAGYKIAGVPEATVEHHFDDQRLRRGQWIDTARRMGWVDAYLAHHWEHSVWSRPAIHALVARLRLAAWRARFSKHAFAMEYVPERLLQATRHCHARLRYLRERRRPRNYARHGLARLDSRQEHGSMLQALPVEQ